MFDFGAQKKKNYFQMLVKQHSRFHSANVIEENRFFALKFFERLYRISNTMRKCIDEQALYFTFSHFPTTICFARFIEPVLLWRTQVARRRWMSQPYLVAQFTKIRLVI